MANDVFKMVVEWDLANGDTGQNVLYGYIGGGDAADISDLIEDIKDSVVDKFVPWLAELAGEVVMRLVRIYAFDVLTGISTPVGDGIINAPGGNVQNALPAGVAVKTTIKPDNRPRGGGVYLPAPVVTSVGNTGEMVAGTVTAALTTAVNIATIDALPLTGLTWSPAYYSKKDLALVPTGAASVSVNNVFDYQRRRKSGVGI